MLRLVLLVVYLTAPFFLNQGPMTAATEDIGHGWDPDGSDIGHGLDPNGSDSSQNRSSEDLDIGGGWDPNG